MKRFIAILLMAMMLLSLVATSAFAARNTVTAEADTWKTGVGYTKRAASGSYWKAAYEAGPASSISCYLYRKGGDRYTKIIPLSKSTTPTTGLDYLANQAVTGDYYKFNFKGSVAGNYTNYFNP